VEVQFHAFLTSALDEDEWTASRLGRFNPWERASVSHWLGGWGGLQSLSGHSGGEERNLCSCQEYNPGHPARGSATILTELPRLLLNKGRDAR
jgi:hypothetical protein